MIRKLRKGLFYSVSEVSKKRTTVHAFFPDFIEDIEYKLIILNHFSVRSTFIIFNILINEKHLKEKYERCTQHHQAQTDEYRSTSTTKRSKHMTSR